MSARSAHAVVRPTERPVSLVHAVSEIREAIVHGRLRPGERLIETELARQLGLSRGPVRDALRELAREGLVTVRANRGAIVTQVTAADVVEVYVIRAALGTVALRQLILDDRVTPQTVARLEALADRARVGRLHQSSLVAADLEFQDAIADASGLPRVSARFRELTIEVRLFVHSLGIRYHDAGQILDDQAQLLEAIRNCDLTRAEALWRQRFSRAVGEFLELIPDGVALLKQRPWLIDAVEH